VSDPLDALRTPIVSVTPDPAFATSLRRRLEQLLNPDLEQEEPMNDVLLRDRLSRNGTRHGDVSYLTLALPDAAAGRGFYGRVLGWTFGAGQLETEGNQVDAVIPQVGLRPGPVGRDPVTAGVIPSWRVDDIGAAVQVLRSLGGTATEPITQPYGLESECTDGRGFRFWLHQLPPSGEPADPNGEREGDVSYVVLRVADLEEARHLFSSMLVWSFVTGTSGLHVEGPVPMLGMTEGPPGVVLCYRVDDIADAVDRVALSGGQAGRIEARPYGLESHCVDDQGVEFYLHQLAPH
jgi:predicted enzyme related to lactoylglutathione lyase